MIRRLRWKLTAFNTAITGAILLGMTLLCLFVSERDTREQAFQSFSGSVNTASAYLQSQDQLSITWLRQMESGSGCLIAIQDGGNPLFSMGLSWRHRELEPELKQVRQRAREEYHLSAEAGQSGSCAFSMRGRGGEEYYAGLSLVHKDGAAVELILLRPLGQMEGAIRRQRLIVALGEIVALGLLAVFSWCFTGKMLRPIQENQRRQAQFTAAASHELRTPLAAILSAVSAMEQAEPGERTQFSDIVRREGRRMTRLIGDLLTLASADSQSWELRPEQAEPDMLLLGVYETYLPQAREKGLNLHLDLNEAGCPQGCFDRERVAQILSILMDNAISYTPAPGDIQLRLTVSRGMARFTVSDTGPGVPEGEKKRIFERFHRGQSSRTDRSHFGLGLCVASEITALLRGRLWVEDAPEGGAKFLLEIPL